MAKRNFLSSHLKPDASRNGDFRPWKGIPDKKVRNRKLLTLIDNDSLREQCRSFVLSMRDYQYSDRQILRIVVAELTRIGRLDILESVTKVQLPKSNWRE